MRFTIPVGAADSEAGTVPAEERRAATGWDRALLVAGIVAGPFYLTVALAQALTRDGFDITRHAVSFLSLGSLGWIQISNFVVTGLLVVGCAIGLRRVRGGTWGPALLAVYGAALVASGVFAADAGFGFPPGTAPGPPEVLTGTGMAHFVLGAVGFVALIAACLVFARRYDRSGERNWAVISAGTGVVLLGAFVGIASGPPRPATVLGLWIAVALSWLWLAAVARRSMGISSSDHDFARRSPRAGRRVAHRVPHAEHERRLP